MNLTVSGFMYQMNPVWFDNIFRRLNTKLYTDHNRMSYRYSFNEKLSSHLYLQTSDSIVPIVHDFDNKKELKVSSYDIINGKYFWIISFI